ncbi:MAG: DUF3460 family protein [Rudaea sp.]
MPLLPSRNYVSDHTRFIDELLEQRPELQAEQRTGRKIWWDRLPSEVQAQRDMNAGRVPQKPYVYYSLESRTESGSEP